MSVAQTHNRLQLPETLQGQLLDFQRRVWSTKMAEAAAAALVGVILAFLLTFVSDRFWDTSAPIRAAFLVLAGFACAIIPLALYRWVWRNRRWEQLAALLSRSLPAVGDQLLGIIELSRNEFEQARSRRLCEAAIAQVAEDAKSRDFRRAVPHPRHKLWGALAITAFVIAGGLLTVVPAAASNAWLRLLAPWKNTPRFTFAAVTPLPARIVVPHGEPFTITVALQDHTMWTPEQGTARLGDQHPVSTRLQDAAYHFELPAQLEPATLDIRVGDSRQQIAIDPTLRPELKSVTADVTLPAYLGRPGANRKDVRGGVISLVKGTDAQFAATASRPLASATVDGQQHVPAGATVSSSSTHVDGSRRIEFRWQDQLGLAGKEPFTLTVNGKDDEPPSLACEDLPRQKVVLDTEQLKFTIKAQDDFGVKRIGLSWQGGDDPLVKSPAVGERTLAAGAHDKETLELNGTFSAKSLGIEPQPINLRVYAEDYLPGRPRVYSPTYTLYVLNAEQHAIWLTEQLSKWHRQSLEVRDREMQLHETNKQLRGLSGDELDKPESRRRIENQAAAERANGRRLSHLVDTGEDLVRQAMRNPEFGVGHLDKWADMLRILKDIAGTRMPSVADLLKEASQAPALAGGSKPTPVKAVGQMRGARPGSTSVAEPKKTAATVPGIVDQESTQQPPKAGESKESPKKTASSPRLSLPATTLTGGKSAPPKPDDAPPAEQKVDEAVRKQQDLLAEFDKIAEELNKILANLEGSTLVKRLKAASRLQSRIAGRITDKVSETFGLSVYQVNDEPAKVLGEMSEQEAKGSHDVSIIMDDMQAYFERRRFQKFKTVLDEMKKQDVIGSLRQIGDDLKKENGVSIAQCEFWSDAMDRWADDLVDPTACGACPGSRSLDSLPPSIVLEVMQVLEAEINLREDTRITQQSKPALPTADFGKQATGHSKTQAALETRVEKVTERIRDLPESKVHFGKELQLLGAVAGVMTDATEILATPETGPTAIAAETEAIELLLQSRRINPKGGGGGGSTPGGGGGGTTLDSALALLGSGQNEKEVREDHAISQTTGESGPSLPEEFRAGLDEYFNRLEGKTAPGKQLNE